jgi:hypothetical protein
MRFDSHIKNQLLSAGFRDDANESVMFARELEHVHAETLDIEYPELSARKLIPVDTSVPTGAATHTWQQYDYVGEAKEVDDYANDFPNVEVSGAQFTFKIASIGASYQYSIQDLRAAAMAKKPLEAMKAKAVRDVMENKLEKIAARGSAAFGLTGLFNMTSVPTFTLPNADWFNVTTEVAGSATTDEIQADVAYALNKIWTDTKTLYSAPGSRSMTMLIDTKTYAYLQSKPQSPTFKDSTIADFLLRTCTALKEIVPWLQADQGAAADGATVVPRMLVYPKDPMVLRFGIPQEFEQLPPQLRGMAFINNCHMRTYGVTALRPLAMAYSTNYVTV